MFKILTIIIIFVSTVSFSQNRIKLKYEGNKTHKEVLSLLDNGFISINRVYQNDTLYLTTKEDVSNDLIIITLSNNDVNVTYIDSEKIKLDFSKIGGVDCDFAQQLCSNTSVGGNNSGFGVQELNPSNRGCLIGNEHQSSWYYINIQSGGILNLNIIPSSISDYDFAIWGPFNSSNANANCPPLTPPIRCDFLFTSGGTGLSSPISPGYQNSINANSGDIYILLVDNFSSSLVSYNINFNTSTAVLGCTPIPLSTNLIYFNGVNEENYNLIEWSIDQINDDVEIILEWSDDLTFDKWKVLNKITANEGTYIVVHDQYSVNENNYYRLKFIDKNGDYIYSNEIVINNLDDDEIFNTYNLLGKEVDGYYTGVVIQKYASGKIIRVIK